MKTIYEFEDAENPVIDVCNYAFGEIEKLLKDQVDSSALIQDIRDKILELKGVTPMSECYVPRYIADLLFESGFVWRCSCIFDEYGDLVEEDGCNSSLARGKVAAPTLQMAYRWLRKHHNIYFDITTGKDSNGIYYNLAIKDGNDDIFPTLKGYYGLGSQEESIILGLFWSLKYILKQNGKR